MIVITGRFGLALKMPEFIRSSAFSVLVLVHYIIWVLILRTDCEPQSMNSPSLGLQGQQELASEGDPLVEGSGRGSHSANPSLREMKKSQPQDAKLIVQQA